MPHHDTENTEDGNFVQTAVGEYHACDRGGFCKASSQHTPVAASTSCHITNMKLPTTCIRYCLGLCQGNSLAISETDFDLFFQKKVVSCVARLKGVGSSIKQVVQDLGLQSLLCIKQ